VGEDRLGPNGGDVHRAAAFALVRQLVQFAGPLLTVDLQLGQHRAAGRVPVHDALAAVDETLVVELDELAANRTRQAFVHGEAALGQVAGDLQRPQVCEDDAAVAVLPGPHSLDERFAPELAAGGVLGPQRALDLHVDADARMVGAWLEQRLVPLHAL